MKQFTRSSGVPDVRIQACDRLLKRQLLYQLSYGRIYMLYIPKRQQSPLAALLEIVFAGFRRRRVVILHRRRRYFFEQASPGASCPHEDWLTSSTVGGCYQLYNERFDRKQWDSNTSFTFFKASASGAKKHRIAVSEDHVCIPLCTKLA